MTDLLEPLYSELRIQIAALVLVGGLVLTLLQTLSASRGISISPSNALDPRPLFIPTSICLVKEKAFRHNKSRHSTMNTD
jgi:hypothetical protein